MIQVVSLYSALGRCNNVDKTLADTPLLGFSTWNAGNTLCILSVLLTVVGTGPSASSVILVCICMHVPVLYTSRGYYLKVVFILLSTSNCAATM